MIKCESEMIHKGNSQIPHVISNKCMNFPTFWSMGQLPKQRRAGSCELEAIFFKNNRP